MEDHRLLLCDCARPGPMTGYCGVWDARHKRISLILWAVEGNNTRVISLDGGIKGCPVCLKPYDRNNSAGRDAIPDPALKHLDRDVSTPSPVNPSEQEADSPSFDFVDAAEER